AAPERREGAPGAAIQMEARRSAPPDHLHVAPQDALRVPRAQRLHRRFLGGESPGEMDRRYAPPRAVRNLAVGEDAAEEPIPVPLDRLRDAVDVGGVEAEAYDVTHVRAEGRGPRAEGRSEGLSTSSDYRRFRVGASGAGSRADLLGDAAIRPSFLHHSFMAPRVG